MENKLKLEIGDTIQRYEVGRKWVDYIYTIKRLTKTLAISECGKRFKISIDYNVNKPENLSHQVLGGVINIHDNGLSRPRYFLINKINGK